MPLFHRGRLELAIAPSTVRVARHWTARQLARPGSTFGHESLDAAVVDAAVLATSELVTNAVRAVSQEHPADMIMPRPLVTVSSSAAIAALPGRPDPAPPVMLAGTTLGPAHPSVSLVVSRFANVVRIEVHDSSPLPLPSWPPGHDADADDESGRGLTVVAALAERWGWRPEPLGKVVWCELAITPGYADRGG
jgi:hypothetical protein